MLTILQCVISFLKYTAAVYKTVSCALNGVSKGVLMRAWICPREDVAIQDEANQERQSPQSARPE